MKISSILAMFPSDDAKIERYAAMRARSLPPPVKVKRIYRGDKFDGFKLLDGSHRTVAALMAGESEIEAVEVVE